MHERVRPVRCPNHTLTYTICDSCQTHLGEYGERIINRKHVEYVHNEKEWRYGPLLPSGEDSVLCTKCAEIWEANKIRLQSVVWDAFNELC